MQQGRQIEPLRSLEYAPISVAAVQTGLLTLGKVSGHQHCFVCLRLLLQPVICANARVAVV